MILASNLVSIKEIKVLRDLIVRILICKLSCRVSLTFQLSLPLLRALKFRKTKQVASTQTNDKNSAYYRRKSWKICHKERVFKVLSEKDLLLI